MLTSFHALYFSWLEIGLRYLVSLSEELGRDPTSYKEELHRLEKVTS